MSNSIGNIIIEMEYYASENTEKKRNMSKPDETQPIPSIHNEGRLA